MKIPYLPHPPRRVVSLVPSTTESLFDLGLGEAVLGITDYCLYPAEAVAGLPRLGGPKNPRVADILALQPDLVLANWEENTRGTVEALQAAGITVWVTLPQSVAGTLEVLRELARIFADDAAFQKVDSLVAAVDRARTAAASRPRVRYFCPIWYDRTGLGEPWFMTFNRQTYCHDLLDTLGGENVFAGRERRYPLAADLGQGDSQDPGPRDTRYPRLSLDEVRAADPEVVLLPNEPFSFDEYHRRQLSDLLAGAQAARTGRLLLVDGSLITWHGTRLARALEQLPKLLHGSR